MHLRNSLGLTIVIVTHDLDTLWTIPDRIIFLGEGKVLAAMPMAELIHQTHPLIQDYFSGERAESRPSGYMMDTKVNYAAVGLFVIVLCAALVIGFVWLSGFSESASF